MTEQRTPEPVSLPFWMAGEESSKLGRAARAWFALLGKAAFWGPDSQDPLTCGEAALELLAWQRGVRRYEGEPERLHRLRVAHAYENGRDAGSINGWQRIFARLELGAVTLEERVPGQDWDVINVSVDDSAFPDMQNILELIINEYGRTCRRYRFVSRIAQPVPVAANIFDNDHVTVVAARSALAALAVRGGCAVFDHQSQLVEASVWA